MRFRKKKTITSIMVSVIIPIMVILTGLFLITFHNLAEARKLAYKYMLDTASLFVEDIISDIEKISSETFYRCENNTYSNKLPDQITPRKAEYYKTYQEIVSENTTLKARYGQEYNFYVYNSTADFLVSNTGIYYKDGYANEFSIQMRAWLKSLSDPEWEWGHIFAENKNYLVHAYSKGEYVFGCYVDLELFLENLKLNNMGYQMIPYIRLGKNLLISSEEGVNLDESKAGYQKYKKTDWLLKNEICVFPINDVLEIEMVLLPSDGIFEGLVFQQLSFLVLSVVSVMSIVGGGYYFYLRLLRPMREFLQKLENSEEELFLNSTDSVNIIELEMVSKEFRELVRRIKTLKIALYEKELLAKRVQLEYVQEQIRPHFYLNCLSIIHAMAEKKQNDQILYLLKRLSDYMRYVISDCCKLKPVREELAHLEDYVEIQKLRYKGAFCYESDVDESVLDCRIPSLVLQTFVENSIKHTISQEKQIEISLYIAPEQVDGESCLYIAISDTGEGFSEDILRDIEQDQPIYYDNRKHIGIANVKKRLQLIYGEKAEIKLFNMAQGAGAVVELMLPLTNESGVGE